MESTEEKKQRIQRCIEKIQKLLLEENCILTPKIQFYGDKVTSEVIVVAKDLQEGEKNE